MAQLSGLPILDIAIGLAFLFFLLSIVCSSVNELIAQVLGLRGQKLAEAIEVLLGSASSRDEFFRQFRIEALTRKAWKPKFNRPSYIPKGTFADAVLDTIHDSFRELHQEVEGATDEVGKLVEELEKRYGAQFSSLDSTEKLKLATEIWDTPERAAHGARALGLELEARFGSASVITKIWRDIESQTGRVDELRIKLEDQFEATMDRASGWYKRQIQWILLVIATVVVLAFNVDTVTIAQRLNKDDALRSSLVAQAQRQLAAPTGATGATGFDQSMQNTAASIDRVRQLSLPLGWAGTQSRCEEHGKTGTVSCFKPSYVVSGAGLEHWLTKIIGLLVTIFALSMGAPFWFDTLQRLSNLRASGPKTPDAAAAS